MQLEENQYMSRAIRRRYFTKYGMYYPCGKLALVAMIAMHEAVAPTPSQSSTTTFRRLAVLLTPQTQIFFDLRYEQPLTI
jgi:hypothetical protein